MERRADDGNNDGTWERIVASSAKRFLSCKHLRDRQRRRGQREVRLPRGLAQLMLQPLERPLSLTASFGAALRRKPVRALPQQEGLLPRALSQRLR